MPYSHHDALHDVKADEHQTEDEAFVQNRVDERLSFEPPSKVKLLTYEQDLGEHERSREILHCTQAHACHSIFTS